MRARKWLLFVAIAVVAVIAARSLGLWAGSAFFPSVENASPQPALVFAEEDLTFGPIPESEQIERELRLTNTSAEPVTVERFETSCACLRVEPVGRLTLTAGETRTLRIKLNASIPANAKLSSDGLFHETVTVDAVVPVAVTITARVRTEVRYTVRQTILFDPPVVSLGVVSHREPVTVKATLTLRPPIQDVRVLPHPVWAVSVVGKGDGVREVTATPTRPGEPRVVNDPLQVVPVGSDGQDRPARPLLIRGEVKLDIASTPADIPLGRVKVGTTVEESFRLSSLTGRKFEVLRATTDAAEDSVTVDPTDANQLHLRVRTTASGDQERRVTVTVKQDDGQVCEVRVPVRYFGE